MTQMHSSLHQQLHTMLFTDKISAFISTSYCQQALSSILVRTWQIPYQHIPYRILIKRFPVSKLYLREKMFFFIFGWLSRKNFWGRFHLYWHPIYRLVHQTKFRAEEKNVHKAQVTEYHIHIAQSSNYRGTYVQLYLTAQSKKTKHLRS